MIENLGSDRSVLATEVKLSTPRIPERVIKITNWEAFRQKRITSSQSDAPSLRQWIQYPQADYKAATKQVTTTHTPEVDSHLLHLWEGRRGLVKRGKRQRHNPKLKQRIARITAEAEEYAATLTNNSWHLCDWLNGTLSTSKTWSILRALLNQTYTKTHTTNTIRTILHKEQMDDDALL
ncbi:hypothetical protein HPB50_028037 [Hyalomma asiaticum]|nr:hypothetical protein HPB50_028037 [Hyalomma asiaticum]